MNIGVVKYSKSHRDLFVYHYRNDTWLRFACQLNTPGMDRCTGPSYLTGKPDYQRQANEREAEQALNRLTLAEDNDY